MQWHLVLLREEEKGGGQAWEETMANARFSKSGHCLCPLSQALGYETVGSQQGTG